MQMPARQHAVVLGDLVEDLLELFLELAPVGDHGEPGRAQHRTLGRQDGVAVALAQVIGGAEGRHPDHSRPKLEAMLDRVRIKAAGGVVERHPGEIVMWMSGSVSLSSSTTGVTE